MDFLFFVAAAVLLIASILGNAALVGELMSLEKQHDGRVLHPKTDYCKPASTRFPIVYAADRIFAVALRIDVPHEIGKDGDSLYAPFWNSPQIDDNMGVVALSPEFVKEKNLSETQIFPWDESKGIYILSFHHSIHCLVSPTTSLIIPHTSQHSMPT